MATRFRKISCILLLLCILSSCTPTSADPTPPPSSSAPTSEPTSSVVTEDPVQNTEMPVESPPAANFVPYEAPPFADAVFHDCEEVDGVKLDLSALSEGYVAVSAVKDVRLKFLVVKDDVTYTYDIENDGTPSIFPIQSGDGHYVFQVWENVTDTKYAQGYSGEADVTLKDAFQPYIRPSDYVPYTQSSLCVKKAEEIAAKCSDELEVVSGVYDYICNTVTYDADKASNVPSGYMPVPDETMTSGKGICFDYASLAAAMLRSQGIPTRVIFGYVAPNDLYHAWNMFYTDETGWVTVGYQVSGDNWNRLDLTFSANGADDTFIGDGTNYTDVYMY